MLSGAQGLFLGGTGPEMHSSGTGPVTFFRGTILAWGAQAVIWGGTAPKCPRGARPELCYSGAMTRRWAPPTRYTLRCNTASTMKDFI